MDSILSEISDMNNMVIDASDSDITKDDFAKICGYILDNNFSSASADFPLFSGKKKYSPPPESSNMVFVEGGIFRMVNNNGRMS